MHRFWRSKTSDETSPSALQELMARLGHLQLTNAVKVGKVSGLGGYADIFEGTLRVKNTKGVKKVAVKKFRVILSKGEEEFVQTFERELVIWEKLKHENILPLLGIMSMEGFPCMVSEWMENGTMNAYLKTHPNADVLKLIQGVACGLAYLHDYEVVHSDLKGENILISADGRPVLSDFGTSRLLKNSITIAGTQTFKGSARWTAPELFVPTEVPLNHLLHTKASDVWAFGMVIYEALVREIPYHALRSEGQVIASITKSELPPKPVDVGVRVNGFELLWECCQRCWSHDPTDRPLILAIETQLKGERLIIEEIQSIRTAWVRLSPTGRFLVTRDDYGKFISFLETRPNSKYVPDFKLDFKIRKIAWSANEEHIVATSEDGTLRKWSNIFVSPTIVAQSKEKHPAFALEFSPDDRAIASFCYGAKLWDASNLSLLWEHEMEWSSAAFHSSGNRVIFYSSSGRLLDVNTEDLGNITVVQRRFPYGVTRLALHSSANMCILDTTKGVKVLSGDTTEEKYALPYKGSEAMQITPNGMYILLILPMKTVVLWDIASCRAVAEMSLPVDLESTFSWSAEISRNCRVIQLHTHIRGAWVAHFLQLRSMYY